MSKTNTVIVVAYPDCGAGNDPEPRGVGSLSQPRLNIFTVGNMRVMICLGQGGLRSLSASSFLLLWFYNLNQDLDQSFHAIKTIILFFVTIPYHKLP